MKKTAWKIVPLCTFLTLFASGCSNEDLDTTGKVLSTVNNNIVENDETEGSVLIAYFTRLPNTQSGDDLDAVVQGGGPYGSIGNDFENADVDTIASASIAVTDDGVQGNVETVAKWIAEYTGGTLFSIETEEKYPLDYDMLIDQGGEEQQNNYRPKLSTRVENMDQYETIFIGYPNWYNDMPMALYSFLEEYNLDGKTIIPFAASAGSGFGKTISSIAKEQPNAVVIDNGMAIHMRDIRDSKDEVTNWLNSLNPKE